MSDKTNRDEVEYSTEEPADLVVKFMDNMSLKQAIVIGHFMGGEVAAKVTLWASERVKCLILVDAAELKDNPKNLPLILRALRSSGGEALGSRYGSRERVWFNFRRFFYYHENPVNEEIVTDIAMVNFTREYSRKAFVNRSTRVSSRISSTTG